MSDAILNLTGQRAGMSAPEDLTKRIADILNVEPGRVLLTSTLNEAVAVTNASDLVVRNSVVGLDEPVSDDRVVAVQLGDAAAPVTALVFPNSSSADRLRAVIAPVAPILVKAGLDAIRPAARLKARADRALRDQRLEGLVRALSAIEGVTDVRVDQAGLVMDVDTDAAERMKVELGLQGDQADGVLRLVVPGPDDAAQLVDWLGTDKGRTATIRRTTKETDIALSVDLDGQGGKIDTGVHFFDHMLDQIARHGGIGLSVVCEGDVEVDSHHTIEDVCLALGDGLREALGDKRGIARFGFETPMDETRASVWIDLSGRPYARFDGEIPGERVGDFPIEMCAHAFRSLAESLRAAIHVKVDGENAHHMVESCFKSFGRALRMAKTIEGDALPSTKGVL